MSEALIAAILRDDANCTGIGLSNVQQRLKAIYGPEYGLQITSDSSKGTSVTIRFPMEGDANEFQSFCS